MNGVYKCFQAAELFNLEMYERLQLFIFLATVHPHQTSVSGELVQVTNVKGCTCPGDILTYECTVMGGHAGSTILRNFSDCYHDHTQGSHSQEIILLHSRFSLGGAFGACDNDTILGQILSADNSSYTSQFNVTVSSDLIGETIECAHDDGVIITPIGKIIIDTTAPYPAPDKISISHADFSSRELIFSWSPVAPDCPAIHYNIQSSNCGSCPTTTTHTTVTCTDVPTDGSMCMFAVQTVVCRNITGNMSDAINITLDSTHINKELLSVVIAGVVLLLLTVTLVCCILTLRLLKRSKLCALKLSHWSNSDIPQRQSTPHKTLNSNYEDTVKVFDNKNMGTYDLYDKATHNQKQEPSNIHSTEDQCIDLDHLLIKLKSRLTSQWYLFGLAIGVPVEILEQLKDYSEEDCLTEVLDFWLRHHPGQPTWQEVADAQRKLEFFHLAKNMHNE